jgi:hypothetical protein
MRHRHPARAIASLASHLETGLIRETLQELAAIFVDHSDEFLMPRSDQQPQALYESPPIPRHSPDSEYLP